ADCIGPEQAPPAPHFDEKSIQNARPAVPLALIKAKRSWALTLVLVCGSSLLGWLLAFALAGHQNNSSPTSTQVVNVTPAGTSQSKSDGLSQSLAKSEDKAPEAVPGAVEAKAE